MHAPQTFQPFSLAMALCLTTGFLPAISVGDEKGTWRTDFAAAQAEAERDQKPLLVHFSAIWCGPCGRMDREVLKSPEVKQLLGSRFIGVKVDSDQHPELMKQFSIQMLPSDLIIDPHNGRVVMESQGYVDLKKYLSFAGRAEGKYQQSLAFRLAKQPQQPPTDNEKAPLAAASDQTAETIGRDPVSIELGSPQSLVGLDGYSPVALSKHRKWVRGSADFAWDYQGVTYQMASKEELAEFRKDPAAFAPRLLGCDPVILWETDRVIPGRTLFGAFYDDDLYLFATAENRKRFKANPRRFIKTQHVLKIDQIDRTALLDESHLK
jgi:YHS domain-containing protein/thioredoxin-related protein